MVVKGGTGERNGKISTRVLISGSSAVPWKLNKPKSTGSPIHNKLSFFLS